MKQYFLIPLLLLYGMFPLSAEPRDLNLMIEDYVLETRQIEIPGFPQAFNASITSWKGKNIMSFRTYDPLTGSKDGMGLIWLDDNFVPISQPRLIKRLGEVSSLKSLAQDPRLIVQNGELMLVYSNLYPYDKEVSRMYVGKVIESANGDFMVNFPTPLIHYDKEIRTRKEKNWAPFVFNNTLILSYSLQPHLLLIPQLHSGSCHTLASSIGTLKWDWGVMRGGTPAELVDGQYLAFFHSDKALSSIQSEGKVMNHYFMGAYTFKAEFPFALTGVSKNPIVHKSFYEGPMYKTWKPLRVVFPCGYVVKGNDIWVSYGRQDHEIWLVRLDKTKLLKSLKPVETVQPALEHGYL